MAATLAAAAVAAADTCDELVEEFKLARPADVPVLNTWLRCALRSDPPQPVISPAHYYLSDTFDVVFVSHAMQALFGIRAHHFMGQNWRRFVEPHDVDRIRQRCQDIARKTHGFYLADIHWRTARETVPGALRVTRRNHGAFHGWTGEVLLGDARRTNVVPLRRSGGRDV